LVYEHIAHLASVMTLDTSLEQHLEESLAILGRYYLAQRVICLTCNEQGQAVRIIYPYDVGGDELSIIQYIQPYMNIRSSLFLPSADAPWLKLHRSALRGHNPLENFSAGQTQSGQHTDDQTTDLDRTVIDTEDTAVNSVQNSHAAKVQSTIAMSAMIPLRLGQGSVGVLFLEDVDLSNKETLRCRAELDAFGSQLGMMIAKKIARPRENPISLVKPDLWSAKPPFNPSAINKYSDKNLEI
jgi:hypothetical protein